MTSKHDTLIQQYLSDNIPQSMAAQMILLAMEEDAIEALIDTYYAGITEIHGLLLLEIIIEIGGYEALNTLRSVFKYEAESEPLRRAAAEGLIKNVNGLSIEEHEQIQTYLNSK